jgi:hypothetical protein
MPLQMMHILVQRVQFVCPLPALPPDNTRIDLIDGGDWSVNPLVLITTDSAKVGGEKSLALDLGKSALTLVFNAVQNNWRII